MFGGKYGHMNVFYGNVFISPASGLAVMYSRGGALKLKQEEVMQS